MKKTKIAIVATCLVLLGAVLASAVEPPRLKVPKLKQVECRDGVCVPTLDVAKSSEAEPPVLRLAVRRRVWFPRLRKFWAGRRVWFPNAWWHEL